MGFEDEEGNWFTPSPEIPSNNTGRYKKHGEWAFPVYPTNRSIQGSPQTPYIWDDRCRPEDAAEQIMNIYSLSKEERKNRGLAGREWAINTAGFTGEKQEDVLASYLVYLDRLSRTIEISDKKLKELDRGGVFEKDDEVGVIFQSILKIQEILNEFNVRKFN